MGKYAIGVDFGTESGRAVLVDIATGREMGTAVYPYSHGVIDEQLPDGGPRLEPDWALQDPQDYIRTFQNAVPQVLQRIGDRPGGCDRDRHRFHRLHHAACQVRWHPSLRPARISEPPARLGEALEASCRPA